MATSPRTTRAKTATPRKKVPTKADVQAELAEAKRKVAEFEAAEKRRDSLEAFRETEAANKAARVDNDIEASLSNVEDVQNQINKEAEQNVQTEILSTLIALQQQVKEQNEEIVALKTRPKRKKSNVGKRTGDKIIRNITSRLVRFRLGDPSNPYRVELKPRGQSGDIADVPASLVTHTAYRRNFAKVFEEISPEEAEAIRYGGTNQRDPVTVVDGANSTVFQGKDVSEDPYSRQVGPNQIQLDGRIGPRQIHQPVDGEMSPEYAEFLNWKRQTQSATPQTPPQIPVNRDEGYDPLAGAGGGSLADRFKKLSGDVEGQALLRYYQSMVDKGVIDAKELLKPTVVEYTSQSVQPIDPDHIY